MRHHSRARIGAHTRNGRTRTQTRRTQSRTQSAEPTRDICEVGETQNVCVGCAPPILESRIRNYNMHVTHYTVYAVQRMRPTIFSSYLRGICCTDSTLKHCDACRTCVVELMDQALMPASAAERFARCIKNASQDAQVEKTTSPPMGPCFHIICRHSRKRRRKSVAGRQSVAHKKKEPCS